MFYSIQPKTIALCLGVLLMVFLLNYLVLAWTEPSSNPPAGNVPAPINVGNIGQSKAGGLILNTGGAATGLVVDKGNVGIGTMAPGYKLDVNGDIRSTGYVRGNTGLCIGADCRTSWPAGGGGTLTGSGNANYISKWTGGTSLGNSQIYDNGTNVGIGTTGPGYRLDVIGSVGADAFYYRSDINLKKDVKKLDIENISGKISQLQGVKYSLKEDDQEQIGLIAQEVEKVFPEVVITKNGEKSIDIKGLVTILLEAIKEQEKKIEFLEAEINNLKAK